ncbi:restriction endonuclease subunit S [Shewanella sp. C32]|uniref:Restriction endonuclease subunit S n=1 Tax=Shewanella electrica TaxID=515560 RepID=A0ABT2FND2_9GAMM|nr:restriction endonuclease subunit S [Shewanella electrica]MCH1926384.1 restriction endonuclease subunit S [Shewanella electrica]MCS4557845.1 restriction endonuclease subunit S [Shewanella electrica]
MSERVPEGWQASNLGDLASKIEGGGTPSRTVPEYWGDDIPWATVKDLKGVRLTSTLESITQIGLEQSASKLVPANTMIIASRMAVGKAVIFDKNVSINQDLKAFFPKKMLDTQYLLQWYLSKAEVIESLGTGSTVKGIKLDDIRALPIDLPPLSEQQKIAKILTSVDEVIEKTQAQIDKLKDLKTGMMQELLTQGVGVDGKPHTEFKDSPVGRIPKAWNCVTLKNLSKRITDGTHQAVKTSADGTIPFLYVSCIRDGSIDWEKASFLTEEMYELASKGRKPENGDILYTAVGSYGHAAVVIGNTRFSFQRHIAFIQPNHEKIYSEFLVSFLNSPLGKKQADLYAIGNAQLTVTLGDLGKFKVILPEIAEQRKIAKIFNGIDNKITVVQRKLTNLGNVKKALMQDLLTGKVRVNID